MTERYTIKFQYYNAGGTPVVGKLKVLRCGIAIWHSAPTADKSSDIPLIQVAGRAGQESWFHQLVHDLAGLPQSGVYSQYQCNYFQQDRPVDL